MTMETPISRGDLFGSTIGTKSAEKNHCWSQKEDGNAKD